MGSEYKDKKDKKRGIQAVRSTVTGLLFWFVTLNFQTLQSGPKLAERSLFNAGYIAAADAASLCHLPLTLRLMPLETVASGNDHFFLIRQASVHRLLQTGHRFPIDHLLLQITIVTDHIHQGKSCPIRSGFDVVRQGHILGTFLHGPEIHQDLICYPPPNDF